MGVWPASASPKPLTLRLLRLGVFCFERLLGSDSVIAQTAFAVVASSALIGRESSDGRRFTFAGINATESPSFSTAGLGAAAAGISSSSQIISVSGAPLDKRRWLTRLERVTV